MPADAVATEEQAAGTEVKVETDSKEIASQAAETAAATVIGDKLRELGLPDEDEESQETPSETGGKEEPKKEPDETGEGDEEAGAEGKKAETPGKTEPAPELDPAELQTARHLGLTPEDLSELGPEVARKVIARAGPKLRQKWADLGAIEQRLKGEPEVQAGEEEESPPSLPDDFAIGGDDLYEADADGKVPLVGKLAQLVKLVQSQEKRLAKLDGQRREERQQEVKATVDGFFDGLDRKVYIGFGKGNLDSLDEESDEAQARIELMTKAVQIRRGAQIQGASMTLKQSLHEALLIVAADQAGKAARDQLVEETRRRSKQRIGRPGGVQKAGAALTAEQRAAQAIGDKARELGIRLEED